MLILLLATCETALERFELPASQVDDMLVKHLERVIETAQAELRALDG